ncbi:MAG: hypothetical protein U1E05_23085 [Patescibacteria group bacterium]|nr:hypothetical protein [Patescibacteria group bacterium]
MRKRVSSHRNWTAVGLPDWPAYPIVDLRGLVSPLLDGWSVDTWVVGDVHAILPSKLPEAEQWLQMDDNLTVRTRVGRLGQKLETEVRVVALGDQPVLQVQLAAEVPAAGIHAPHDVRRLCALRTGPSGESSAVRHLPEYRLRQLLRPCHCRE